MENLPEEPEELIERRIIALLADVINDIDIEGALSPALEGVVKTSADTFINVTADQSSQDGDYTGMCPNSFTVKISVHYANADEKTGTGFRDTCRKVRKALGTLLGDGCTGLNGDGFECDIFQLQGTDTRLDASTDDGAMVKTYTATLTGRYNTNSNTEA